MRVAEQVPARTVAPSRSSRASLPQEQVVARLRQSGRRLVVPALLFVSLCGCAGLLWHRFTPEWLNLTVLGIAGLAVLLLCVVPMLRWLTRVVLVTNRRLVVTRGVVVRRRTEFLLVPGAETTLRRGPLQLLAGSGDVIVRAGGEGTLRLRDVPSARLVHASIVELVGRLR